MEVKSGSSSILNNYLCAVCPKSLSFVSIENLEAHVKVHELEDENLKNDNLFECFECGVLASLPILKSHRKSHNNKVYNCEHCSKSFSKTEDLNLHLRVHDDLKVFDCKSCSLLFANLDSFLNHLKLVHDSIPEESESTQRIPCHLCGLSFIRIQSLEMHHLRNHTSRDLLYTETSEVKNYKQNVENMLASNHQRLFQCSTCDLKFCFGKTLKLHTKVHERPAHICHFCKIIFRMESSLSKHLQIHSERNFECVECNIPYKLETDLIKHDRIHSKGKV